VSEGRVFVVPGGSRSNADLPRLEDSAPPPEAGSGIEEASRASMSFDARELLREIVETPSLSGDEGRLAAYLVRRARELGLVATIDEAGNFIAATNGDPLRSVEGVKDIVLLGHMDVVPGDVEVRQVGDLLYGRGTVDAKGPLATFVMVAALVKEQLPSGVRVVVIGAVEEEIATSKGARAVVSRYVPSACVIGEPSRWDSVTIGYKGRLVARYSIERSMSHTAGPALSAADSFHRWWQDVLDFVLATNAGRVGPFQQVQSTIRGMTTVNDGITERCEGVVAFRLPADVHPEVVEERCRRHCGEATLEFSGAEEAIVASRTSALARALTASIRANGGKPGFVLKTGTSDMNVVGAGKTGWKCPVVAYGPGDSSLDHTPDEHIDLKEFERAIEVLRGAIVGFAGTIEG
jgi:LysW-gamma-L-lysine carboxypeptidase